MNISLNRDSNNNLQLNRHEVFVILNNIRYNKLDEVPDKIDRDIIDGMRALFMVLIDNNKELDKLVKVFNKFAEVKYTYKHNYQLDEDYVSGYNVKFNNPNKCIDKILDIVEDKHHEDISNLIKYRVQPYEQDM